MTPLRVDATALRAGELTPPVSKSDAQRALVLARTLNTPQLATLEGPESELPSDVRVMARGLAALDTPGPVDLDCADGGAPFRILLGQAAITSGKTVRLTGTPRLGERPHQALIHALVNTLGPAGLRITTGSFWPVTVNAPTAQAARPTFAISGTESSQFVTSLLLAAAALQRRENRPWTVELTGPTASEGYLDLTLSWLERCGFTLSRTPTSLTLTAWQPPKTPPLLPGDWSSLGYLLCIAWRTGAKVHGIDLKAAHPDRAVLRHLGAVGLTHRQVGPLALEVSGAVAGGLEADASECPDLMPTLAALACVLPAPSRFTRVGILRVKESDRLRGIQTMVESAGGRTVLSQGDEVVELFPPATVAPLRLDSHDDHRLAMAAATLAVLGRTTLELTGPDCVQKSFPGFWRQLERVGVQLTAF